VWQSNSVLPRDSCRVRLVMTRPHTLPIFALGFPQCDLTATEAQYRRHGCGSHHLQALVARVGNGLEAWARMIALPTWCPSPSPSPSPPPYPRLLTPALTHPFVHVCFGPRSVIDRRFFNGRLYRANTCLSAPSFDSHRCSNCDTNRPWERANSYHIQKSPLAVII
jgi:hypothetical protein